MALFYDPFDPCIIKCYPIFQENVWKLADHVRQTAPAELSKTYVVFVSNRKQVVPLWRQRAGRDEEKVHENTLSKISVTYLIKFKK